MRLVFTGCGVTPMIRAAPHLISSINLDIAAFEAFVANVWASFFRAVAGNVRGC